MTWYKNKGDNSDIVLLTKVQLSRNLAQYPFPSKLSTNEKEQINRLISDAVTNKDDLNFIDMKDLSKYEIVSLAEKHLISPEFASDSSGRALLLSNDEDVAIMLQEEDHVKIQAVLPGLSPEKAYELCEVFDSRLENSFQLAFNEKLGFLTQCPTNIGTALRVSVLLHLPALNSDGAIQRLGSTVSKLGMILRPAYGDRNKVTGDLFTLSNQVTLGITEDTAIKNLQLITGQIIAQEKQAREHFVAQTSTIDNIWRSVGILKYVHSISSVELANLLSYVRLGAAEGIVEFDTEKLTRLFIEMQSATLNVLNKQNLSIDARDKLRAEKVREAMN